MTDTTDYPPVTFAVTACNQEGFIKAIDENSPRIHPCPLDRPEETRLSLRCDHSLAEHIGLVFCIRLPFRRSEAGIGPFSKPCPGK